MRHIWGPIGSCGEMSTEQVDFGEKVATQNLHKNHTFFMIFEGIAFIELI